MVRLQSDSLNSKYGFDDGDLIDDILWGAGYVNVNRPADQHLTFEHEILSRLVETHLLPALPPVEVSRIGSSHNPIRAQSNPAVEGVYVDVSEADVLRIAEEVALVYGARKRQQLPE